MSRAAARARRRGRRAARGLSPLVTGAAAATALLALTLLERRRPLRRVREAPGRHLSRNLAVAAGSALAVRLCERPLVEPAARRALERRTGLIRRLGLPGWLELPLVVLALDYTLFLWHVLTHKVPPLWRFHAAHHADRDMDASTALRFHFVEMALSAPWRLCQVRLLGATPLALTTWQLFTLLEILFHHSNWRLPRELERRLEPWIVTPRMHGIHHSIDPRERESNWSNGISLWDRMHGTWRPGSGRDDVEVGLAGWRGAEELTLGTVLLRPLLGERRPARTGRLAAPGRAPATPAPPRAS